MAMFAAAAVALPGRVAGTRRFVVARASATMPVAAPAAAGRTHYEVLGVGAAASRGEIKAAYRRLAREVHPDAAGDGGDEGFIRLHAAYATLADPDERALYDRDVAGRAAALMMRQAAQASQRSGGRPGRRTSAGRTTGHTRQLCSFGPGVRPSGSDTVQPDDRGIFSRSWSLGENRVSCRAPFVPSWTARIGWRL